MEMTIKGGVKLRDADFRRISDFVYSHCGINLHDGKRELVHARLSKRLRATGFKKFSDYIDYVFANPESDEFSMFIDSLSTNLTSFFREQQHFVQMSQKFLPQLIAKKPDETAPRIRIWSAGCSSGQEPYSIAITLKETLGNRLWNTKILATDISGTMLTAAAAGLYPAEKVLQIPVEIRNRYFRKKAGKAQMYQVCTELKNMIIFRHMNLLGRWPVTGPVDFIFCRNVMIYFDKPTQQELVRRFESVLSSGGVLFTGHSESLTGINHNLKYINPTVYMKV